MDNTMLSVLMTTFNHEAFIAKAIEGVLLQETIFSFELIIGEDCSTDDTRKICEEYAIKYPDKIKLLPSDKNWGMMENFIRIYSVSTSSYLTLCEGDDYWTDPLKLQKQVDFLEQHPDYNICFHNVKVFNENTQQFIEDSITRAVTTTTTLNDLAFKNYLHTPSVVFRNKKIDLPDWYKKLPIGDYPLWCMIALTGKIYKMEDEMCVYRVHDKGAMSLIKQHDLEKKIASNNNMITFYDYMYSTSGIINFRKNTILLHYTNITHFLRKNNYANAKKIAFTLLKEHLFSLKFKQLIIINLTLIAPTLVKKYYAN